MATHSSILAQRIPWTEEPGRLQSMGSPESDTTQWLKREREWEPPIAQEAQFNTLWWPKEVGWKRWWEGGSKVREYVYVCAPISPFNRVQLSAAPWTVAHQAPLSMGFSRQEYWSRLPFPPPGDLPDPGIKPLCLEDPSLLVDSLPLKPRRKPGYMYTCS